MNTLHTLFDREIEDLYSSVNLLLTILKRMSSTATNRSVVEMLDTYYSQTQYQKKKLDEFFCRNSQNEDPEQSQIMSGIRDHAMAAMHYRGSSEIRDVVLLLSINIIKHFEKTLYGTLLTHASRLKKEDLVDLFLTMKKKVAEDEKLPADLAIQLLGQGKEASIKKEASELLITLTGTQLEEQNVLLDILPNVIQELSSELLKEAVNTYQIAHQSLQSNLVPMQDMKHEGVMIAEWSLMQAYVSEMKDYMSSFSSAGIKDIAAILSLQRIQHQQMSLLEFEILLSEFIGQSDMKRILHTFLEQEKGYDQSFSAIAEGSIFHEGLDSAVKL